MHKYFVFILSLTIFFIVSPHASANWEKSNINPVSPNPYSIHVYGPEIINVNGEFQTYYTSNNGSGWKVNLSTIPNIESPNNWTNSTNDIIPIGSSDNWEKEASDPSILKVGNSYYMWYTSTNTDHWVEGEDRFRTRRAISTDGINWTPDNGWVMSGDSGKWDSGGTSRGRTVLYHNGLFHMWYSATNSNNLSNNPYWGIGYATSVNGIDWNKRNNGEPVVTPTESWEYKNLSYPYVMHDSGKFKMYYATGDGDLPKRIIYAESTDGISWNKSMDLNPVIDTSNGFDSNFLADPFFVRYKNKQYLFYSGFNGSKWSIGYATKDIPTPSVPLLKQTSNPWQSQVYNGANIWSPGNPSMYRWGCAVTSLAMLLQYHGYEKLPNNQPLDPGTLNTWLKSQSDGYVYPGLVNWHAISRLSKQAKTVNNVEFDALEFSYGGNSKTILKQDLEAENPVILETPGHFLVATAVQDTTFLINDPYYDRTTLLQGYGNTFSSMRRYIPSNTDLSYVMLVSDPSLSITIKNKNGVVVSEGTLQNPIKDPVTGKLSGKQVNITYIPKINSEKYTLEIKSNTTQLYTQQIYLYDTEGNVVIKEVTGVADKQIDSYILQLDKNNMSQSTVKKSVTFTTLLNDLKMAKDKKFINNAAHTSLSSLLQIAEKDYKKKNVTQAKLKLETSLLLVSSLRSMIDDEYEKVLISEIKLLKDSL